MGEMYGVGSSGSYEICSNWVEDDDEGSESCLFVYFHHFLTELSKSVDTCYLATPPLSPSLSASSLPSTPSTPSFSMLNPTEEVLKVVESRNFSTPTVKIVFGRSIRPFRWDTDLTLNYQ